MPTIYSANYHPSISLFHDSNGYYHLIYMIVNKINNKIYIGKHSTKDPYDNYMGSGKAIRVAVNKYGAHNFEKVIIDCLTTEDEAYLKESEIVDENFVKRSDTYNMKCGGDGFSTYDASGEKNPMYGKHPHRSKETREKMSKANKGKYVGEKNPMYGRHGENSPIFGEKNGMYGKHLSQETKDKISKAMKEKYVGEKNPMYGKHPHRSKETREKMSKAHIGKNPCSKAVQKIDIDGNIVIEYQTITECRKMEHIGFRNLAKLIVNNYQRHGYYYRYKEKNNE